MWGFVGVVATQSAIALLHTCSISELLPFFTYVQVKQITTLLMLMGLSMDWNLLHC